MVGAVGCASCLRPGRRFRLRNFAAAAPLTAKIIRSSFTSCSFPITPSHRRRMRHGLVGGSSRRLRRSLSLARRRSSGRRQNRPHHHAGAALLPPPRSTVTALRRAQLASSLARRKRLRCRLRIRRLAAHRACAQHRLAVSVGRLLLPQPSPRSPRCEARRPALLDRSGLPAPAAVQQPRWELAAAPRPGSASRRRPCS